jgi:hypothetical protein
MLVELDSEIMIQIFTFDVTEKKLFFMDRVKSDKFSSNMVYSYSPESNVLLFSEGLNLHSAEDAMLCGSQIDIKTDKEQCLQCAKMEPSECSSCLTGRVQNELSLGQCVVGTCNALCGDCVHNGIEGCSTC